MKQASSVAAIIAVVVAPIVVAAGCWTSEGEDARLGSVQSAVTQPPESERDKCHGAPSCKSERGQSGCRVRGQCVEVADCPEGTAPDPCQPSWCCDFGTLGGFGTCTDAGANHCPANFPYLGFTQNMEYGCCTEPSSPWGTCQLYTNYCR